MVKNRHNAIVLVLYNNIGRKSYFGGYTKSKRIICAYTLAGAKMYQSTKNDWHEEMLKIKRKGYRVWNENLVSIPF